MSDVTYRGRPANYSIEIALTVDPSPQVGLVQVHGEDSLYHEWINQHGYRVQYLGVRVEPSTDLGTASESAKTPAAPVSANRRAMSTL